MRLIDGLAFIAESCLPYASDAYWLPRSEWQMRPLAGRCRCVAIISAARGSSVRIWSRIAQPTILRVARSSTAARYSHPSPVAMKVMSASQTRFGAGATNVCFSRFGATGR